MRELLAKWIALLASRVSEKHRFVTAPKGRYDTSERLKRAVDQINGTMYQVPKSTSLWVLWDKNKPAQIVITHLNTDGTRDAFYPTNLARKGTNRWTDT